VVARDNTYVLFVTDPGLASQANSFEWTFKENGTVTKVSTTGIGEIVYQPATVGTVAVVVRILSAGAAEQASLTLEQQLVSPSDVLEESINEASNAPGPGADNPDVDRELVNEHSSYYQQVKLQQEEPGDAFQRFLFSMVRSGAARRTPAERRQHLEQLNTSLENQDGDFARLTATGVGVCGIRLALLAMILPQASTEASFLNWKELPVDAKQYAVADEELQQTLSALAEGSRIDLFNVARFPKSNIAMCGRILESLRNRYFAGATFENVLTGMSGTRARWIAQNFWEGPLTRQ
jgi:hypothetical protein